MISVFFCVTLSLAYKLEPGLPIFHTREVLIALTALTPRNPILLASTPTPTKLSSTSLSRVKMGTGMRISDRNKRLFLKIVPFHNTEGQSYRNGKTDKRKKENESIPFLFCSSKNQGMFTESLPHARQEAEGSSIRVHSMPVFAKAPLSIT